MVLQPKTYAFAVGYIRIAFLALPLAVFVVGTV